MSKFGKVSVRISASGPAARLYLYLLTYLVKQSINVRTGRKSVTAQCGKVRPVRVLLAGNDTVPISPRCGGIYALLGAVQWSLAPSSSNTAAHIDDDMQMLMRTHQGHRGSASRSVSAVRIIVEGDKNLLDAVSECVFVQGPVLSKPTSRNILQPTKRTLS